MPYTKPRKSAPAPQDPDVQPENLAPGANSGPAESGQVTVLPPAAKQSKLSAAVALVTLNMTEIQALGADIAELEKSYPANHKFDLATKDGAKLADKVRADARKARLAINNLYSDSKKLLNGLKDEAKAVAEPYIASMQAIEDNAKAQIEAAERAEAERKERHERNIAAIAMLANVEGLDSAAITARMDSLAAILIDDSYQEYRDRALNAASDARDTLTAAFADACDREEQAARDAAARAAEAAELAEARAKEERTARIREKIKTIKELPDQVAGTGSENIRTILAQLIAEVPHADTFGDMLEYAEMAHELAVSKLRAALDEAIVEESPPLPDPEAVLPLVLAQNESERAMIDALRPCAESSAVDDDLQWPPEEQQAIAETGAAPPAFTRDSAVSDAMRTHVSNTLTPDYKAAQEQRNVEATNMVRHVARQPIPQTPPAESLDLTQPDADIPDLLAAAKAVVAEYAAIQGDPGRDDSIDDGLVATIQRLRAAVEFVTEFAD